MDAQAGTGSTKAGPTDGIIDAAARRGDEAQYATQAAITSAGDESVANEGAKSAATHGGA